MNQNIIIKSIIQHDHIDFIPEMEGCFNMYKSIYVTHINTLKDKIHMIISLKIELAFNISNSP